MNDSSGLDLERMQTGEAGGEAVTPLACADCQREIATSYFTRGEEILCEACSRQAQTELQNRSGGAAFLKAGTFGLVAAMIGAALWGGIIWITEYELGIVAIVVGLMVGAAVKIGSGGQGGVGYQVMAVSFTYLAVTLAYVPLVVQGFSQMPELGMEELEALATESTEMDTALLENSVQFEPVALGDAEIAPQEDVWLDANAEATGMQGDPEVVSEIDLAAAFDSDAETGAGEAAIGIQVVVAIAAVLPFLAGFENVIGLLIIGIALFEAWKINRRVDLTPAGPFQVGVGGA